MTRRPAGFTVIELLVAMALFSLVSIVCVMLLKSTLTVSVWGDKRMDMLRQNREITKRLNPILRGAAHFNGTGTSPVDTVASTMGVLGDPIPVGHVEQLVFWTSREHANEVLQLPVVPYPAAGSFVPPGRPQAPMNPVDMYTTIRVFWLESDKTLRVDPNTPLTVGDDRFIGRGVEKLDFLNSANANDRSILVDVTTRSRSQDTRIEGGLFTTHLRVHVPNW
ncbi:MAG: prepilin-type N-terminal cleavage/methylation domain-containing protein [Candidatus Eremiobacterota bacterium]